MNKNIALIGNPNCGKSTLFNILTNSYQKTGNWTGVTTEKKISSLKKNKDILVVDLPGIYSLSAKSDDERAVINYLKNSPPDVIINIIDGTNLERNLYLTIELARLNIPIVLALNMIDILEKNNIKVDLKYFSEWLGVPIIPISAIKDKNIDKLIEIALTNRSRLKSPNFDQIKGNNLSEKIYFLIEEQIKRIIKSKELKEQILTLKMDNILMHKFFGLPIFFCILTLIYFLSISIGGRIGELISSAFNNCQNYISILLDKNSCPNSIIGLIGAILKGLGSVFSLLPQILILYALLAILEQSGYSSRVAFLLDMILKKFGLSGKSLIPMMVSCGCTVAGLSATRTIEGKSERRMSIFLTPFMPCGAKMAVFGHFSYALFNGNAIVATSMYFLSILCIILFGSILKKFKCFDDKDDIFILEIPLLKMPNLKDIYYVMLEKAKDFLIKIGLIVISLSIILWILKSFNFNGYVGDNIEKSIIFYIGNGIKWIFYPLGFCSWQASVSIFSGILAKEGIVETLNIISPDISGLFYNKFSAYAFMAFVLLSPPCLASLISAKRELSNNKWFLFLIVFQFVSAYMVALIINLIGIAIESSIGLLLLIITAIIVLAVVLMKKIRAKVIKKEKINVIKKQNSL